MSAKKVAGLTGPQIEELRRLGKGRQSTYGYARARVQNNLYYGKRLVRFVDDEGREVEPHHMGLSNPAATGCEITEAGRRVLTQVRERMAK